MNSHVTHGASIIQDGGIVAFPTETVYGLGADATNNEAVLQIFEMKQRPSINPLIVHVASLEQAATLAEFNEDALKLSALWPGPLSMVLPLKHGANIAPAVLAGLSTIALRIPAHPIALELIKLAGHPIAAPSANISGYISATTAEHVKEDFGNHLYVIEDHAWTESHGLESTIIDLSTNTPTILRHGFITADLIQEMINREAIITQDYKQIKAPGMMARHYSPRTFIRLNATSVNQREIGLNFGDSNLHSDFTLSAQGDLVEAARNLYIMLRHLDEIAITTGISCIAVASIPNENIGIAINDRLKRAASK